MNYLPNMTETGNTDYTSISSYHLTKDSCFYEAGEAWIHSIRESVKESTMIKYQNMLTNYIYPELSHYKLFQITFERLNIFCQKMLLEGKKDGTGLSPKTVSDLLSVIRSIIFFARDEGIPVSYYGKKISLPRQSHPIRVLSKTEQCQLCRYLVNHENAYTMGILVCLFTGMRIGEICALQWTDINIEEKYIYVHRTLQRLQSTDSTPKKTYILISSPKSQNSIRYIPLPDFLFSFILKYHVPRKGYFLTGKEGKYIEPRIMQQNFNKVMKSCDIKNATFHTLRHTFATRCIELGFDPKTLSSLLGHSNVNITLNRYVHPSMDLKRQNMTRLSILFPSE